jgi:hypothetical protein
MGSVLPVWETSIVHRVWWVVDPFGFEIVGSICDSLIRSSHGACAIRAVLVMRSNRIPVVLAVTWRCERCLQENRHDADNYDLWNETRDWIYTALKQCMCVDKFRYTRNDVIILLWKISLWIIMWSAITFPHSNGWTTRRKENSWRYRDSNPDPTVKPVACSCTVWAILAFTVTCCIWY